MDIHTINQLNTLNRHFYENVANDFADSRQFFWPGWYKLETLLKQSITDTGAQSGPSVLDVGCGTGRWATFFAKNVAPTFTYVGIDNSADLLTYATQNISSHKNHSVHEIDVITELLNNNLEKLLLSKNNNQLYDVIVTYGFMHHVPSHSLRTKLISVLLKVLKPSGILVTTFWQFLSIPSIVSRIIDPESVTVNLSELEPGDYIIDWQRGNHGIRYCHQVENAERTDFISKLKIPVIAEFLADGKTDNLNYYMIWKKSIND